MNQLKVKQALEHFFIEDIGDLDVTSDYLFDNREAEVEFQVKQSGVFCGGSVIVTGFQLIDPSIQVHLLKEDGEKVSPGEVVAIVKGNQGSLLKGERVVLNLVQRMSGIATLTALAVKNLHSEHTKICDTRKTTPGLRMFEKYAVRMGGGFNHRNGLYDAAMIKDNHIALAGSITKAVHHLRKRLGHMVKIEVETETEKQVREAVEAGVDCVMFDNRTVQEIQRFIQLIPPHIITEASGSVKVENLSKYSNCGVDYISLGCLTHSVASLDISVNVNQLERGILK
ncbi:nicotinate-nucleotide diphosphorylase (carboxylating) [Halobacillus andaensis]|uniref:Probable nicotinate-nucleotide pyrophosphorylase [carboxylating] n=1 Tax=Halobacillus andaensis TaxID=1176239 RepID=A0A917B7Q9_HALAA|nr:carboxylating nicotinate-nucleotide diphosphorylase [Halobacillus andaensis]MBP2005284.1 nicotinate-nucleotide pyrophosphorylase (carboxylating) [Halobacillus andaensis]GGF30294.1 nicotinate-nucleotide diphosphorylase (carboxylating) [Halobacillus andaensis]